MKDLIQASVLVTVARVVGIALQSLIIVLLAWALPVSHMGVFALSYTVAGFARLLGPLGTDQVTMRLASSVENQRADKELQGVLNTSLALVFGANVLVAIVVGLATFWGAPKFYGNIGVSAQSLLPVAFALPAFAINGLLAFQIRGFGNKVAAQVPDSVGLQVLFGAGLLYSKARGELDLETALLWVAISAWVVALIYVVMRYRIAGNFSVRPSWKAARMLLTEGRQVLGAKAVITLSARGPVLFAAPLLGPAATAVVDIALRFGTLPTITTSSIATTFGSQFAVLASTKDRAGLSRTFSMAALLAIAPALLVLAAITVGAPLLIGAVLPAAYADSYLPMLLICLGYVINASFGIASMVLFMSEHGRVVRNFALAELVVLSTLSLALGPTMGPFGLSIAVLAGIIVRDVGQSLWVSRHFKIQVPPLGIVRLAS